MDDKNKDIFNFVVRKAESTDKTLPFNSVAEAEEEKNAKKKVKVLFEGKLHSLIYVCVVLLICVVISAFTVSALNDIIAIAKPDVAVEVTIPEGAGTKKIAKILKKEGLIKYPGLFTYISRFENHDGKYTPGDHIVNRNMGYTTIMRTLQKSKSRDTVTVTIPEGYTLYKMANLLQEKGVCNAVDFMKTVNSTDFGFDFEDRIPTNGKVFYKMEGYLFPDTYEFYKKDTPLNVIVKMLSNFDKKITDEIKAEMTRQKMDLHELITIASIVQGEAPNVKEMKKVASVYLNRLNSPSAFARLEADPTRNYAIEQVSGNNGPQDVADAYNTYVGLGLPPGPINNPGIDAILAVLYPEDTPYYFFCTNLRNGEFYYAKTFEEHNANVRKAGLRGN